MVVRSDFETYMAELDEHIRQHLGFTSADLREYDFFSDYSEGVSVEEAAERAVIAAEGN